MEKLNLAQQDAELTQGMDLMRKHMPYTFDQIYHRP